MGAAHKSSKPTPFARLKEQLQAVDLLFEVRDARVPLSSAHPKAGEIFGNKPRLLVLTKADLGDPDKLAPWLKKVAADKGQQAICLSLKIQKGKERLLALCLKLTEEKRAALARKGLLPRPIRVCVVGLPNVGKSSLINWLIGRKKARTGDMPGVTRGTQWVRVHPQIELLDTPGILPPTVFGKETSMRLSLCNLLPEVHYDNQEVAEFGLAQLAAINPKALKIYGEPLDETQPNLQDLAIARRCLATGGKPDTRRAATILLNDLREGKLGPVLLDELR